MSVYYLFQPFGMIFHQNRAFFCVIPLPRNGILFSELPATEIYETDVAKSADKKKERHPQISQINADGEKENWFPTWAGCVRARA
jgi:hypothetical protein